MRDVPGAEQRAALPTAGCTRTACATQWASISLCFYTESPLPAWHGGLCLMVNQESDGHHDPFVAGLSATPRAVRSAAALDCLECRARGAAMRHW